MPKVEFLYFTGIVSVDAASATLLESWDAAGHLSAAIFEKPMTSFTAWDGCPGFLGSFLFFDDSVDKSFRWGLRLRRVANEIWASPKRSTIATLGRTSVGLPTRGRSASVREL
jgi:hypothetical protein